MSVIRIAVYVGLGSNLDHPAAQIKRALSALAELPETRLLAASRLYRNPPMGPQDQPDYVNAVASLETALDARHLLAALQAIERAQGRVRGQQHWGPRTIDLDLLLYGSEVIAEPGLVVPHPGIAERAFVLIPLHEIAPTVAIPGHAAIDQLLARVDRSGVIAMAAIASNELPA